ncbi:hypothetical protein [Caulobacter segnis]|uniref:hypothetical protein n=1 Tax=Caulobacter segnis TaxID=88688 RepID=UPI002863D448|nr:hypothetical protein [Caulobacter segnis]MDR6625234.1 hypothetical protein [Caulobacter segnis]
MTSSRKYLLISVLSAAAALATPALAQVKAETRPAESASENSQKPEPSHLGDARKKAMDIGSQPARDIGMAKREIPASLRKAHDGAYDLKGLDSCKAIETEIASLNEALGPDFDVNDKPKAGSGKMAEAGGKMLVNGMIPFRGLVREISGAASADRHLNEVVDAGLARRGFLRGVHLKQGCQAAP